MPRLSAERLRPYETAPATRRRPPVSRLAPLPPAVTTRQAHVATLVREANALVASAAECFELLETTTVNCVELQHAIRDYDELLGMITDDRDRLRMQLMQRDDLLAAQHAEILALEQRLTTAAERLRGARSTAAADAAARVCECCFEPCETLARYECSASARHVFCAACVERACRSACEARCRDPPGAIGCLSTQGCDGRIKDLEACAQGRRLLADHHLHAAVPAVHAAVRSALARARERDLHVALEMLRADGTYRGLQCPRCGFGPLWNDFCSEFVSHHLQAADEAGRGVAINNACPRCGILTLDERLMDAWDGVVQEDATSTSAEEGGTVDAACHEPD